MNSHHHLTRFTIKRVLSLPLLFLLVCCVKAQSTYPTDGTTPLGLKPGAPAGAYSLSGFDNLNLYNGNLNFRLPLVSLGGRGSAGHTITLPFEQHWQVETATVQGDDYTETHYYPTNEWWDVQTPAYSPGIMHVRYGARLTWPACFNDGITRARWTLTRLTFTTADGTEYELRDALTGGAQHTNTACATSGWNRGKVFVTADGSGATFVSDNNIVDLYYSDGSSVTDMNVSGYLFLRDGARYRINGGYVASVRDRNGNKINFTYGGPGVSAVTDSLNRQVTIAYNVAEGGQYGTCDKLTFKGYGGANRIVRVCKSSLSNLLRSGYTLQTYAYLFPNLEGSSFDYFNPTLVSDVWLPNDQRYQIRYNSYGEVARVVLPTGGAVEYDHGPGWASGSDAGGTISSGSFHGIYRRLLERREYADGTNLTNRTTYGRYEHDPSLTSGYVIVDQFNSGGSRLAGQKHYFFGYDPGDSILISNPTAYPNWQDGKEYETEAFDTNGTTVLRRTQHTWEGNGTMGGLTINPRITESIQTIEPSTTNLISRQTFTHDQYNNVTNIYEYDFGTGAAGSLVRRTQTTYVTTNNGYDYACDPASTCSASLTLSNVVHLRNLQTLLSTRITQYKPLKRANKFELRNTLADLPEVKGLLERYHVTVPRLSDYVYFPSIYSKPDADLSISHTDVRGVLNKIARESEHNIWFVQWRDRNRRELMLGF